MSRRRLPPLAILLLCLQAACGFALAADNTAQPPPPDESLPPGATARFGSLKWRMPGSLRGLAISPDGKRVAASARGAVAVWDIVADRELYYLSGPDDYLGAVAISPDSQFLAVAAWGQTHAIRILELATGKMKMQIKTQEYGQEPLAFAADSKKLVSGGDSSPITVWDLSTGKKQWDYRSEDAWAVPFAVSSNGRWLAASEADQKIAILHFETGKKFQSLFILHGYLQMAFSPDARSLAVSDNKTQAIYEVATGKLRTKIPIGSLGNLCLFAPNGKKLALFGEPSNEITWVDPFTGQLLDSWKGHQTTVTHLAISQDGRTAVSGSSDGNVHVWDAATSKVIRAPDGLARTCDFLAFSDDDKTILAVGHDIHFLSAKALEEQAHLQLDMTQRRAIALSPNGKTLACAQQNGSIVIIDVSTRKVVRKIQHADWEASNLAFGPDSKTVYGFGLTPSPKSTPEKKGYTFSSRVWNVATGVESKPFPVGLGFFHSAISPQGKLVEADIQAIPIWNLETGKQEGEIKCHAQNLLFSHDGNVLATKLDNSIIKLHDFQKRNEILTFKEFESQVYSWCFSHDDKILALGHSTGSFTLWSIPAGKKLAELPAHRGPVTALAFSHDGETLVTGSSDGTILKWPAKAWRGK